MKYFKWKNIQNKKAKGRPKKYNERETKKTNTRGFKRNCENTTEWVNSVNEHWRKNVSNNYVKNVLKKNNFRSYKKRAASLLPYQIKVTLKNYTYQDWRDIIFTDNSVLS